jgi:hypothetical protein
MGVTQLMVFNSSIIIHDQPGCSLKWAAVVWWFYLGEYYFPLCMAHSPSLPPTCSSPLFSFIPLQLHQSLKRNYEEKSTQHSPKGLSHFMQRACFIIIAHAYNGIIHTAFSTQDSSLHWEVGGIVSDISSIYTSPPPNEHNMLYAETPNLQNRLVAIVIQSVIWIWNPPLRHRYMPNSVLNWDHLLSFQRSPNTIMYIHYGKVGLVACRLYSYIWDIIHNHEWLL